MHGDELAAAGPRCAMHASVFEQYRAGSGSGTASTPS
jgi:hypothetical protein